MINQRTSLAALATLGLAVLPLTGSPARADTVPVPAFAFTGTPQIFTVPAGVCYLDIVAYGAAGGTGQYGVEGGKGAEVRAVLPVSAGQTVTVDVGGRGRDGDDTAEPAGGGYGGGGIGGAYRVDGAIRGITAGGGGGRTMVSLSPGGEPVIVAGGGGGGAGTFFSVEPVGGAGGLDGTAGARVPGPESGNGGASGGSGGAGGLTGATGVSNGTDGGSAVGPLGGRGGDSIGDPHGGAGGGGGGGVTGGGGGAAAPSADRGSGGGGGGGSSLGPLGAAFTTGAREGDGEVTFSEVPCPQPPPPPAPEPTPTPTPPSPTTPTSPPPAAHGAPPTTTAQPRPTAPRPSGRPPRLAETGADLDRTALLTGVAAVCSLLGWLAVAGTRRRMKQR